MKSRFMIAVACASVLMMSGCATDGGYNQAHVGMVKTINKGVVVAVRNLSISDEGSGALLGGILGGVAGSQVGKGDGKTAATIGGALVGAMMGSELNKDAGQELTIRFDNGQEMTTVYKVDKNNPFMFRSTDRVVVEMTDGRVTSVKPTL